MSASISPLSLTVVRSSSLPRTSSDPAYASLIDSLFTNAQALTTSLATWKTGKTFTPTYTKPDRSNAPLEIRSFSAARPPGTGQDDTKWFARVSTHKDANYEGFVQGLLKVSSRCRLEASGRALPGRRTRWWMYAHASGGQGAAPPAHAPVAPHWALTRSREINTDI